MLVLAITLLVLVFIMGRMWTTEGFNMNAGSIDIDHLTYSDKEQHPEKKNRPIYTFPLPLPLNSISGPRKNSSKVVAKELDYLVQLTNQKNIGEKKALSMQIEKNGSLTYFLNFAGSNGLIYDKDHLTKIAKDVETLAFLMKSYYNRPRPYQLGFLLGKNINPVLMANSSSFPCEHSMISKALAHQLSYNNPKFKDQLHSIAKRIELSRYYSGLNFPSDTVASLKVAEILRNKMQYLEGG